VKDIAEKSLYEHIALAPMASRSLFRTSLRNDDPILGEKNKPKLGAYAKGFTITTGRKHDSIEMFNASNPTSPPRHFRVGDEILDATAVISAERLLKLMELEGQEGKDGEAFWALQLISVLISHTRLSKHSSWIRRSS
jgi:hypothetical protein